MSAMFSPLRTEGFGELTFWDLTALCPKVALRSPQRAGKASAPSEEWTASLWGTMTQHPLTWVSILAQV